MHGSHVTLAAIMFANQSPYETQSAQILVANKLQLINIDFHIDFDQIVKISDVSNEKRFNGLQEMLN